MKWIKYIKDFDDHKAGEVTYEDDRTAKILVKSGNCEETTEPAEAKAVADAQKTTGNVDTDTIDRLVVAAVKEATKGIVGKRFSNPADPEPAAPSNSKAWATARRNGSLKNFSNNDKGLEECYRFGMFMAGLMGSKGARKWCEANGLQFIQDVDTKVNQELSNANGGFLVPIEFDNTLIDLREKFGVFRQYCRATPMMSDTKNVPRRKKGIQSYFAGEDQAGTQDTKQWDQVQLVAKKLFALTKYSNEISEDAIINLGDDLAGEIAWSFAIKEDQCGFLGDGTSTYGGIQGVITKLLAVDATPANILGLTVGAAGTGASWNGFALRDFNNVVGSLPEFADGPEAKWYTSKAFWGGVMQKLATAAGGNNAMSIVDGARVKEFLGYEVVVSQVMPKTAAVNQVPALFGNLSMAAAFGDRRMTSIKVSDSALNAFEQDEMVIRGTERFDIVVHDVGESSVGTARDSVYGLTAGPIVGLGTASS